MLPEIKERFNPSILAQACERFGVDVSAASELDAFENFIYELEDESPKILRLSHSLRRSTALMDAELHWIEYLADHGAPVSRGLRSTSNLLSESVDDSRGGFFIANLFEKAPGEKRLRATWTTPMIEAWGAALGVLHRLTLDYDEPEGMGRFHYDDPTYMEIEANLSLDDSMTRERIAEIMEHLAALPRDAQSYGLIHNDAHYGNFFVDSDSDVTLFDFDDCCYGHFVKDIAVVFWHAIGNTDPHGPEFRQEFYRAFMKGYLREHSLERQWLDEIPWFLRMRDITIYAVIRRTCGDPATCSPQQAEKYAQEHKWLLKARARYESRVAAFDLDWQDLG